MAGEERRECTVCVKSEQRDKAGERRRMETRSRGRLSEREGVLYVLYEENAGDRIKNLLKIEKDPLRVSLKKSGGISWKIHFEAGKRDCSEYSTPYGTLEIGVQTERVTLHRDKEKTSLQLLYALWIQGEKQADCRLEIEIL